MTRALIAACLATAALAFAQSYRPWTDTGFGAARVRTVESREMYPEDVPEHTFELPLTVVLLDQTNWTEARALRELRKTAAIFAPCGIVLGDVQLARGRGPDGGHDIDMAALYPGADMPAAVVDFSARVAPNAAWPRVFLVGRLLGDTVLARSYQQGAVGDQESRRFPYMNTAWISYRAHWDERAEKEYSSLAHELAHVLCRCGHTGGDRRHLLHEKRNFLGAAVLEPDCRAMQLSPLLER
ncbi:MAG: hypothetical protein O3A53_07865 [Acidobacteria bacterium]|nr:hypothetical protein [Acidobacteriota bacterium]MDA1234702.1 hypothetical protein [Acidobacteriota bacterium]